MKIILAIITIIAITTTAEARLYDENVLADTTEFIFPEPVVILTDIILFGLADVPGYNIAKKSPGNLIAYRYIQAGYLAVLTIKNTQEYGMIGGAKTVTVNWTFGTDMTYNGWLWLFNMSKASGWETRADIERNMSADYSLPWAWWTPGGLLGIEDATKPVGLMAQTIIGVWVTVAF